MRILYSNKLDSATITSTNGDVNYPPTNVLTTSLLIPFKATTNNAIITADLADPVTVSTFALGGHNLTGLQVTLTKEDLTTVVYTYTAEELQFTDGKTTVMLYEEAVEDVVKIEYFMEALTDLFVGGLSAGQFIQMPPFNISPTLERVSSGARQKSRDGVTFNVPGVVLERFTCSFDGGSLPSYNSINSFFDAVQVYAPYYVDRWEGSGEFPVMFGQNTRDVSWRKADGLLFDAFTLIIEECK